jgi:restriction endonuclease
MRVPDRSRSSPLHVSARQTHAMSEPAWQAYEQQIVDLVRSRAIPGTQIATNVHVPGLISGVKREVDVLVKGSFAGVADALMVLDCKCYATKVDVKDVEAFLGMLEDIGANMGMLVTTKGFSNGAERRATSVIQEIVPLIDIVLMDQVADWWMVRAGESGSYRGDYVDHEPYGGFWWRVLFVTGGYDGDGGFTDEEEDILWSSDSGGWDAQEQGDRMLATVLARHRLARNPSPDELENLTLALRHAIEPGPGFEFTTGEISDWLKGFGDWACDDSDESE